MKYIITGGLGFIGSNLYERLIKEGEEVLIIDYMVSGLKENIKDLDETHLVNMDIRDESLEKYFDEGDVVIHLAGISSLPRCQANPAKTFDINVSGTLNILEICRKKNVEKLIFASSSTLYENNTSFPLKEDDPVNPTLLYSLSKYTCERLCHSYIHNYNMNINMIRFFNVYGGNQDDRRANPPLTAYIIKCLHENRVPGLQSDGEQKRDYIYIDDLIELIYLLLKSNLSGETFNGCSGTSVSVNEIFNYIQKEMGSNITPTYSLNLWDSHTAITSGKNSIKNEIIVKEVNKYTLGDYSKAKKLLNWEPKITVEMGLKKLVQKFYERNPKSI